VGPENKIFMNPAETLPTLDTAIKLGLTEEEFQRIQEILGRMPNFTELSIFSVMWSEHCSYKNSIKYLKTLPREGGRLLVGAGEENAGLVDIGDGLACAFKIESHNHPSALEPYQGAATGVGGIHRDIFTMGARPIAALNSLRFGEISRELTQRLVKGVVAGIGDYGNCLGVPTIGGEVYFNPCYNQNILVNAMSIGTVEVGKTISAVADGPGNPVFIVGSATGKDGIHGATFASADLTEDSAQDLPAVQVGDPFQEKLLLEATLELIPTGVIVGMQDMGAAGITCSTSEMSAKSKTGMRIDLSKVPTRQSNMLPFEILLSESQERMLIVVKQGEESTVKEIFEKWDLECEEIGFVTDTGTLEYYHKGEKVAEVPADPLVLGGGAPVYDREYKEPSYFQKLKDFKIEAVGEPDDLLEAAKMLWQSPNLVSKRWIFQQYDSMVRTNTISANKPTDASIIRIKGTQKSLAATVDCNSSYVHADPYVGTMIAVSEAARNITCSGGVPLAVTNCLNFGNPYNPEVYWQFVHAIKGMGEACRKFDTPVTGGNVSFYNQSVLKDKTEPIYPTPTIGMIGLIENERNITSLEFKSGEDLIYLLGPIVNCLGSSEYLRVVKGIEESHVPYFDLEEEIKTQNVVRTLIENELVRSAHDVSEGGLLACLMESSLHSNLGFEVVNPTEIREDAWWFGESQSRVVITLQPKNKESFLSLMQDNGCPYHFIGKVHNADSIKINNLDFGSLHTWKETYDNTLNHIMQSTK
jgi:phosphoribosylformylglycinamidine synthase subunit PurL